MHPVEIYLTELRRIRLSGAAVPETSYYGPLASLLNEAGDDLRPKVRCIINLKDTGGGIPDGGFFTADQFPKSSADEPSEGQLPSRGALEVKGLRDNVEATARGEQVARYAARYGQVLVTNLRSFVLVELDESGESRLLESFDIGEDEEGFRNCLDHPRKAAQERGDALLDYLRRVLLRPAPLTDPKDLAWFLASYAREALSRIEDDRLRALDTLKGALEASLGIRFEGERGEHFFRSTLVQTLFYGVFSSWVLWNRQGGTGKFDWQKTAWTLRVPMIRALFHQVADPERLKSLHLVEVLDWAGDVLDRVDREAFFKRFREEHAVQYFYEPFLEAFDPELRKQLGVWYTPPEVVKYMVAKVDHVLRTELDIPDGLADERVVVLDPCCGTGAYLVEVLHRIEETLRDRGESALVGADLKKAAMKRVFGFDIMPAPFVVAHLQLGLLLQQKGVPFKEDERAGVYLTNALTGWVPPEDPKEQLAVALPELAAERDQADHVKRDEPILVILGNPPYSGYAGMAIGEERDLTDAYRETKRAPKPQGQGLNDLYVRFFRMAERKITEMEPKRGVVCLISNYSWLDGLSFTGMRERFLERFDRIWIDNLNGDKYRTGKTTPEGAPDPSIFSTPQNREGIQVGTAIATLVRGEKHRPGSAVGFRDLWGSAKLAELGEESRDPGTVGYSEVKPLAKIGFPLAPRVAGARYLLWPRFPEMFPSGFPGVLTGRDAALVSIDREPLERLISDYFSSRVDHDAIRLRAPKLMTATRRFGPLQVREALRTRGLGPGGILRYSYRPMDSRWLYWDPDTKLLDEKRTEFEGALGVADRFIAMQTRSRRDWSPPQFVTGLGDYVLADPSTAYTPLLSRVRQVEGELALTVPDDPRTIDATRRFNLSALAVEYLERIGSVQEDAPHLFHHAIAVMHAPAYREENSGALRQDWPRIPLPESRDALLASAALGRHLAALLNPETDVPGVTSGNIRPELRPIAPIVKTDGGQIDRDAGDLDVSARWGYSGARGVTMPGPGRAEQRPYTENERDVIDSFDGLENAIDLLGSQCVDVYLNDRAFWRCVPARVWEYTLGGYQVMKKWLSYREIDLLGRALKVEEVREVTHMARRIAAILLLEDKLDESYRAVCDVTPGPGSDP